MIDPIARTIANLIRMRGGVATLVVKTAGVYDPATSKSITTEDSYDIKHITFNAKDSISPNSLIRSGDRQMFVQAEDSFPAPEAATGTVILNGQTFKIISANPLNPSGVKALMYELILRT